MTGFEIIGAIASIAGGVVGAMGAQQSAQAQAAAANYNAKVSDRNAQVVRNQAAAEQMDKDFEHRRQLGAIRAAYGASGIDPAGSPLDVLQDTAMEQELEVKRVGYEGELRAIEQGDKATAFRMEAKAAKDAGAIGAISSIIGGVSGAARGFGGRAGSSLLSS